MKKRGFSMVELMIVIAIIAVLASIIMPKMSQNREKAKLEGCKQNLHALLTAVNMYMNDNNGSIPPLGGISAGHRLLTQGYLKIVPVCPGYVGTSYSYGFAASSLAGEYYVYCRNVGRYCHPALNTSRPVLYLGRGHYLY